MRVKAKKQIDYRQIITTEEEYEVVVNIARGKPVTLKVEVEDGCFEWYAGLTDKDKQIIKKLTSKERDAISELLRNTEFE